MTTPIHADLSARLDELEAAARASGQIYRRTGYEPEMRAACRHGLSCS